ncbi:unnamed protein product [Mycena citricolor]|uniref:F-box domain-containing protein n=1 Tax=Mycena citricolor TaxID=2018698 RepID=A0AAD2H679_9AGAR|nr:unnamed protein product [Mycena citricolor]
MPAHLPVEIVEQVLDSLTPAADTRTLGACGLVCPGWNPRSRHIMFSSLVLSPRNIVAFQKLLISPQCTLATSVFALCIDASPEESDSDALDLPCSSHALLAFVNSPLFALLSGAQSLHLRNFDWTRLPPASQAQLARSLSTLSGIRQIHIDSCSFHDAAIPLSLASMFPLLHSVRFQALSFSKYLDYNLAGAASFRIPANWSTIEVDAGDTVPVVTACVHANLSFGWSAVRQLILRNAHPAHREHVEGLLRCIRERGADVSVVASYAEPWQKS